MINHASKWPFFLSLATVVAIANCAHERPDIDLGNGAERHVPVSFSDICSVSLFPERFTEHLVSVEEELRPVSKFEGIVQSETGRWPPGVAVAIDYYRAETDEAPKTVFASRSGKFSISEVSRGKYCLRISAEGWRPLYMLIEINPDASDTGNGLEVELSLGV